MIWRMHPRRQLCAGVALSILGSLLIGTAGLLYSGSLGPAPLGADIEYSKIVLDREGRLLRPYTTADGKWRLLVPLDAVDPRFIQALIAYEDKRFRSHFGVDLLALFRATAQFVSHGRIVSGGSTLTMQVARLLEPRSQRSIGNKLWQIVRAVQIERVLSKDDILALYLNLAPYGGNIEGVRAASLAYFGKEPRLLSPGETALLVSLPQSPEARRPDRSAVLTARNRVLTRVASAMGIVEPAELERAASERVPTARLPMPILAPHAAQRAMDGAPEVRVHRLTIDAPLQRSLQELARDRAQLHGSETSVAIVVADHASGEVLARVASSDYFDAGRAGQVDMTQALRSPGSTLKPFIYALGFEDGLIHPETQIEDRPTQFGSYAPENFDLTFQGTVTIRKALQLSLNVPAVAVLDAVGPHRLTARLSQSGTTLVLPRGESPGLAMGLGGTGIRLVDLTMLYAGIARGGNALPLVENYILQADRTERRLLEPAAAWQVGNILIGTPPPDNAPRGQIAFKTGTSYGYRDAWAVGFDGRRAVGVWVGRADGAPSVGLLGRTGAAPILFDVFARMGRVVRLPERPRGVLVSATARLPPPLQFFRPPVQGAPSADGPRIIFPPNGARLDAAKPTPSSQSEAIPLKITGGEGALTVLVNGVPLPTPAGRRGYSWQPDGPGFARLTVMDRGGRSDTVLVRVE